ncbi:amino acid adenylation domain-containing protein, partial [Chitinophaga oryziterrae]
QGLQQEQIRSRKYQYASLSDIQRWTELPGDLFDSILVFENFPFSNIRAAEESTVSIENATYTEQANYPLHIIISTSTITNIKFHYNATLIDVASVDIIRTHFSHILQQLLSGNEEKISDLDIFSADEKQTLLTFSRGEETSYPYAAAITDLFAAQVLKTPEAIALVFEKERFSYHDLDVKSNQVSHYLKDKGVKEGMYVPVCLDRGADLIISILGILKAGAVYVPIDPSYPAERIKHMLHDCAAHVFITAADYLADVIGNSEIIRINIDAEKTVIASLPVSGTGVSVKGDTVAYIMYTSGSTGIPKGVMVTHGNVVSLVNGVDFVELSEETVLLSTGSPSFDAVTIEYWGMLLNGGRLVMCSQETLLDIVQLKALIYNEEITTMWFTSGWFNQLVEADITLFAPLKTALIGGDRLSPSHIQRLKNSIPQLTLINGYGPTENTTFSLTCKISNSDGIKEIPIGKPLSNRSAYVLDSNRRLCPVGVTGELYVGGAGLSDGYLHLPALTAERFVTDHLGRLYRTGDMARWMADGNLEFMGRMDNQIKLRGYRIELGEIEQALLDIPGIRQAVVLLAEGEHKQLLAFLVAEQQELNKAEITTALQRRLPSYMIPAAIYEITEIPLTPNGKIDREVLLKYTSLNISGESYEGPRTQMEAVMVKIWEELLGVKNIGINDNFFALGGDSIITIQVVSRAKKAGYSLTPRQLFLHPTIATLSTGSGIIDANHHQQAEQGMLIGSGGLLPIQHWFFEQQHPVVSHFNQEILLCVDKAVSSQMLQYMLDEVIRQHDALRFTYHYIDGQWIQEYTRQIPQMELLDISGIKDSDLSVAISAASDSCQQSLDIEKGKVFQAVFMKTPDSSKHNRLLLLAHHLVTDGVSWRILLDDMEFILNRLMEDLPFVPVQKTHSYREYHNAIQSYAGSEAMLLQRSYWEETVAEYRPLRTDKKYDGRLTAKDISTLTVGLNDVYTHALLKEVSAAYNTEISDILLSALASTLNEFSGNTELLLGLEGHGRDLTIEAVDVSRTVGWFTSLYPVLLRTMANDSYGNLIKGIKEQLRAVPDKGIGYGILKYLSADPLSAKGNCWDVTFNYLGQLDNILDNNKWLTEAVESAGQSMHEENSRDSILNISCMVREGRLEMNWNYSRCHFGQNTIARLAGQYIEMLLSLIKHCTEQPRTSFTPSDYGLADKISYKELDAFMTETVNGVERAGFTESIYRLSGLQEGMLFHSLYDPEGISYLMKFTCELYAPDTDIFRKAWEYVLNRHSILRSGFYYDRFNIPVQCVYSNTPLSIEIIDCRDESVAGQQLLIDTFTAADLAKGFDFTRPPLMRITLFRLSEKRYSMLWTSHHILCDGWSIPVLVEELLRTYETIAAAEEVHLQETDHYEDYIRYIARQDRQQDKSYWRSYLSGLQEIVKLPFGAQSRTDIQSGNELVKTIRFNMTVADTDALQLYARNHQVTLNTVMQATWSYLLHRYTGSTEVLYGVVVAGRPESLPHVEQRVGMYINTLPCRSLLNPTEAISEWLQNIQRSQLQMREHQYTPLSDIRQWVDVEGEWFDTALVFENYPVAKVITSSKWKLQAENARMHEVRTNIPLIVKVINAAELIIQFEYNSQLLAVDYIELIRDDFEKILHWFLANPEGCVSDIRMYGDKTVPVYCSGPDEVYYAPESTLSDLFIAQAQKTPDATAVILGEEQLTYSELDTRTDKLGRYLRKIGVKEETLVPVCMHRSVDMIVAILGILKAGAAYVPLDPAYPPERINYMLEDTGAGFVLTDSHTENLILTGITVINLDTHWLQISAQDGDRLENIAKAANLAYVIYTSGSTGHPKGVLIEHGSVVNLIGSQLKTFGIDSSERILQFSNYSFDASVEQIFLALLSGATLVLM